MPKQSSFYARGKVYVSFFFLLIIVDFQAFGSNETLKNQPTSSCFLNDMHQASVLAMKKSGINPVLATRVYLYANVASYQAMHSFNSLSSTHLIEELNDYLPYTIPDSIVLDSNLVVLQAYYQVMHDLIYEETIIDDTYQLFWNYLSDSVPPKIIENSLFYGSRVADHVLEWASKDGYMQTKSMPFYIVSNTDISWRPTPPDYRRALEPYWGSLRPAVVDSLSHFSVEPPPYFSQDTDSGLVDEAGYVFSLSRDLTGDQIGAALFWDDNPDMNRYIGHEIQPRRHVNPTSHWMNIIAQILAKENLPLSKAVEVYTMASISFYDANLVAWKDKYHSNLIRLVTLIREYIDFNWSPILVTPSFPEYPRGHSTCSAACVTVLEHFLGKEYGFSDSTHNAQGLGIRYWSSLREAMIEVSNSRVWGGIHFPFAVESGMEQGRAIGESILQSVYRNQ